MTHLQHSIETYIHAKDGNRPHLIDDAFTPDAELSMALKTAGISFPDSVKGAKGIADVLVSQFAKQYENVYTFCIGAAPAGGSAFRCDWLVCMSEKSTGLARAGFGSYDWQGAEKSGRIKHLTITIDEMATLPAETLQPILTWVHKLPYPWCPRDRLRDGAPKIDMIEHIVTTLEQRARI